MRNNTSYLLLIPFILLTISVSCKKETDKSLTVTDADGNVYQTVKIGEQVWMAENLKTTKLNDGITLIPEEKDNAIWLNATNPKYCWYNNIEPENDKYGALYNGYAVNTRKLCPLGWKVPDNEDWQKLETFLGGEAVAGDKLKASGFEIWKESEEAYNSGFNALPTGFRSYQDGTFILFNSITRFWSTTKVDNSPNLYIWQLIESDSSLLNLGYPLNAGFCVRCIQE